MTDLEVQQAWHLVNRYGPSNCWTGDAGTLAAALGRALEEVERLRYRLESRQAVAPGWLERRNPPYEIDGGN